MTAPVKVPGRRWAVTGAILGGIVSIAANVAHSLIPPIGATANWHVEPGAVVSAIVWPVFLYIAVEILARTLWPAGINDRVTPPIAVYGTYGQRIRGKHREHPSVVEGLTSPSTQDARTAMGIDWLPWPALTQAIPPAYTHWLGVQLLPLCQSVRAGGDATPELGDCVTPPAAHPSPPTAGGDETRRRLVSPDQVACVTGDTTDLVAIVTGDTTPPAAFRHCRCGRPLPTPPATGRWPRHCCHACRQAAYRDRLRTRTGQGQP